MKDEFTTRFFTMTFLNVGNKKNTRYRTFEMFIVYLSNNKAINIIIYILKTSLTSIANKSTVKMTFQIIVKHMMRLMPRLGK